VPLPSTLSVSQLVVLGADPDELARRLRRPVPVKPAPWARRGTAFHAWLESRWSAQTLLDVDDLPGAADESVAVWLDTAELSELQAAFEASAWATRTPAEVEVPFEMAVGAVVVRGRMDAVFATTTADGSTEWTVLDWKTGSRPTGIRAQAAAIQLAAYRIAWARLAGLPDDQVHRVRAAFHYVRDNVTVAPVDLLDVTGLAALIAGDQPVTSAM
jgi:DNA helicase-2/ATP-dependent DNA helicase PcrA